MHNVLKKREQMKLHHELRRYIRTMRFNKRERVTLYRGLLRDTCMMSHCTLITAAEIPVRNIMRDGCCNTSADYDMIPYLLGPTS